jgi:UDP:flavonoid glycosyltransferase YjiC (YdhE family)
MFPTNGVGFGHFTRMLALARRMGKLDSSLEVIFFTTMPTLHLLKPYGIASHHISGPKYFDNLEPNDWNSLLEEKLRICLETHRPKMFIFDGAFPYRGMLRAIQSHPMRKVWVRRGMFRKDATNIPVDSIEHFDVLVRPGDSRPADSTGQAEITIEQLPCNPILLAGRDELLPREELRERLSIPQDATVVYVQLGAGEINDIESDLDLSVRLLSAHDVYVVVGESMIGNRLNISGERIRTLRDYPNSLYFNSFDFAIMAGGYNSYHEAIAFQLPTICIPNKSTGMDDQVARAMVAGDAGAMLVVEDVNEEKLAAAIESMLDTETRSKMIDAAKILGQQNGADELAEALCEQ